MNITVGKLLEEVAKQFPNDEAVKFTDRDYRRTWKEFNEEAETIAKGFLDMGIQKGDHVAIWATNVPEWMLTFYACTKIGAVLVTVNTAYKVFELEYLLRQSDSKMLVLIDKFKKNDYIQIVNDLCPTLKNRKPGEYENPMLPFLKTIVYAGDNSEAPAGMLHWKDLYKKAENIPDEQFRALYNSIDPQDICNMQYTS
ncbi:MAG: AMP-binding protein, partial [Oscillospiraceae bacterium]|nr:AMP-binding protein [Oscillospiraceae bacterium]